MTRLWLIIILFPLISWADKTQFVSEGRAASPDEQPKGKCVSELESYSPASDYFKGKGAISTAWVEKMRGMTVTPGQARINDAVRNGGLQNVILNRDVLAEHNSTYTHELTSGCVSDQKASGRCWIFAWHNMLRSDLLRKEKTDAKFEFSNSYMYFFSMLERSNHWLQQAEETYRKPHASRKDELESIKEVEMGDGGWANWFKFLVAKYGMVPKSAMPETKSSGNTAGINVSINTVLSEAGNKIKRLTKEWRTENFGFYSEEQQKKLMLIRELTMERVYTILATHLGTPPTEFEFRKDKKAADKSPSATKPIVNVKEIEVTKYTPAQFRDDFVNYDPDEWVTIMNSPFRDYMKLYEMNNMALGVTESGEETYAEQLLNLPFKRMDKLITDSIDAGWPLWFGVDVKQLLHVVPPPEAAEALANGVWHLDIFKFSEAYGFSPSIFDLTREERLQFQLAQPSHAMAITGYDRPDPNGPVVKYKVENSWNTKFGEGGFGHMYHGWAEVFLDQIVVNKALLTDEELKALEEEPEVADYVELF